MGHAQASLNRVWWMNSMWFRGVLLIALIGLLCAGCVGDYING